MAWVSPTGFVDPGGMYSFEFRAYDEDLLTCSNSMGCKGTYYLELTHAALSCDKVQIYVAETTDESEEVDPTINLDVYYGGTWHNIFSGSVTKRTWVEKAIGSTENVTAMRMALVSCDFGHIFSVFEADFNEVEAGEEKLLTATCSVASSTTSSLTLGKIESLTATSTTAINVPSTTLQLLYSITAHAPPATSTTGNLSVVKSLSGTSSVQTSVSGTLLIFVYLTSSASVASTTSGSLTVGKIEALSGIVSIISSVSSPNIRLLRQIAGTSSATSVTAGSLTLGRVESLTATSSTTSSVTGSLSLGRIESLSGTASATSAVQGDLTIIGGVLLSGTASVNSVAEGSLTLTLSLVGTASATSLVEGTLSVAALLLSGTSVIVLIVRGQLTRILQIERLEPPEGVWERQELPTTLFCGEEIITCGNEYFACGGGYVSPKVSRPTGVWVKQDAPA